MVGLVGLATAALTPLAQQSVVEFEFATVKPSSCRPELSRLGHEARSKIQPPGDTVRTMHISASLY